MERNSLLDKLPLGIIVTDNHYKIRYYNSFVSNHISSDVSLIESELINAVHENKGGKKKNKSGVRSLSINTRIFQLKFYETRFDDDHDRTKWIILLFDSNEFFNFDNELGEANKLVNRLQSIIDFSYDGIYVTDHMGTTLCVNKSYERITGVKIDEVIGKNIKELEVIGMFSPIITPWVLEHKQRITVEQTVKAGKKVVITGNPVFGENDEIQYIITNVRDMTEINQLRAEVNRLKQEKQLDEDNIVYRSAAMKQVLQTAAMVSDVNISILLLGESGVGKEVIAKHVHEISNRKKDPFIAVNCGALVSTLLESELFGYEAGAFTGASKKGKQGLFEIANRGVIFLDEIGDMTLELQGKLLRVLQEGEIQRVGGTEQIPIDVRVICATNKNLAQMVAEGAFREDLYYRLDVVTIEIPPLRERKDDIALLLASFADRFNKKYGKSKIFSADAIQTLTEYRWPGNVRELRNLVEQLIVLAPEEEIDLKHLPTKVKVNYIYQSNSNQVGMHLLLERAKGNEAESYGHFIHLTNCPEQPYVLIEESDLINESKETRGASSELIHQKILLLASASGGTIFLKNLNTWKRELQNICLGHLQEIELSHPNKGYNVIVSINSSIEYAVKNNQYDYDLFKVFKSVDLSKVVPAEKKTITSKKIQYYIAEFESKYRAKKRISERAMAALESFNWEGSDKLLRDIVENIILIDDENIDTFHLPDEIINEFQGGLEPVEVHRIVLLKDAVESVERQLIEMAIKKYKTTRKAAEELGMTQPSIVRKRNKLK